MDRQKSTRAVSGSPMQMPRRSPLQLLLQADAGQRLGTVADATRRRDLYGLAVLWLTENRSGAEERGARRQPQACATDHAASWPSEQSARAKYLEATPRTHQIPVLAQRLVPDRPSRGLEHRYHLHSIAAGGCVSSGC